MKELFSISYWTKRYNRNGGSGDGSRGPWLEYKANYLNEFIKNNKISNVLDFGSGDLYVAKKLEIDEYTGLDCADSSKYYDEKEPVGPKLLSLHQTRFDTFVPDKQYDLVTCLDVFYHIMDDEGEYLKAMIQTMFDSAREYIIVYSLDSESEQVKKQFETRISHTFNSPWREIFREHDDFELVSTDEGKGLPGNNTYFFVFKRK